MTDLTFVLKAKNEAAKATKAFSNDMKKAGTSTKQIKDEAAKARKQTDSLGKSADKLKGRFKETATAAKGIRTALKGLGALVAGISFGALLGKGVQDARAFSAALAEVGTLIDGNETKLRKIEAASSDFVKTFGGTAAQQAQAFYQTISAGVTDVGDATNLLEQANKLAIGGITDVTTAVDILTTAVNAYGPDVITAAEASDSLFVAMRAGKTTVGELSSSLGQVIPVAASLGVTFDELTSTVAALTTRGVSTRVAVTGLRGVLAAVAKPTKEAEEAAKELGIAFNSAAIEGAGGLVPFLENLIEAADGNVDVLARLFGGVEALIPVLSLAGGGIESLGDIIDQQNQKLGASQKAYEEVAASLDQRLTVALSSIAEDFRRIGDVILTVAVPALEVIAGLLTLLTDNAGLLSAALAVIAGRGLLAIGRAALGATGGLTGLVASLVASTTFAKAKTRALKALSRVMKLMPWAIFISGAQAVGGIMSEVKAAIGEAEGALDGYREAGQRVQAAGAIFDANPTKESLKDLRAALKAEQEGITQLIETTQNALESQNVLGFDVSPAGAESLRASLATLQEQLAANDAALQSLAGAEERLTEAQANRTLTIREEAQARREVVEASIQQVPTIDQLRSTYGVLAEEVQRNIQLQNEFALAQAQIDFSNTVAEISELADGLDLSEDAANALNARLVEIKQNGNLAEQAAEAGRLAREIIEAAGGVKNLDAETAKVVGKLFDAANNAGAVQANANGASGAIAGAANNAANLANNLNVAARALGALQAAVGQINLKAIQTRATTQALQAGKSLAEAQVAGDVAAERNKLQRAGLNPTSSTGALLEGAQNLKKFEEASLAGVEAQKELDAAIKAATASISGSSGGVSGSSGGGSGGSAGGSSGGSSAGTGEKQSSLSSAIDNIIGKFRDQAAEAGLTGEALEEYRIKQELLKAAQQDGVELSPQVVESVLAQKDAFEEAARAAETFAAGAKAGFADFADSVQTNMEFARDFTKSAFSGLSDTIAEFVKTGKADFKGLLVDLLGQIAEFLANRLIIDFLGVAGGGTGGKGTMDLFGGGGGGLLGGLFGGLFGGGLAEGGPARAGTPYLIGEEGPELFVPRTSGTVMPNDELMGSGSGRGPVNMTFNITTQDADSFRRSQGQIEAQMSRALERADRRNN